MADKYFKIHDEELRVLKDKVVIVTGCSSGIGLATTQLLLSLGAKVVGGDVNPPSSSLSPSPQSSLSPSNSASPTNPTNPPKNSPPESSTPSTTTTTTTSPLSHPNFTYHPTNVTSWTSLTSLFSKTLSTHNNQIDHIFANAGIGGRTNYVDGLEIGGDGEVLEPDWGTVDVNLRGVVNCVALGVHYLRRRQEFKGEGVTESASTSTSTRTSTSTSSKGSEDGTKNVNVSGRESGSGSISGSIVLTASASSFQPFRMSDYTVSKHGVLGLMRGVIPSLAQAGLHSKIRVNCISPSWTVSGLVSDAAVDIITRHGKKVQYPGDVARSVALLMADETRTGQNIYSVGGRFREVEGVLVGAGMEIMDGEGGDDEVLRLLVEAGDKGRKSEVAG